MSGAEALRHVNYQVMEDVEDSILGAGFPAGTRKAEMVKKI
jgi:hypothetical protein